MAFGAKIINPIDFRPGTGVGVSIPFNVPGVFKITYTTQEATKVNLINFFLTNQNERYLNPNFGGNLRAFIFQQISDNNIEGLKEDIQSQLATNFPQVVIDSLEI
jgi:GTP-dependent phosphoenolpyruvate carboxykinase